MNSTNLQKNSKLLNGLQEDGNIVVGLNSVPNNLLTSTPSSTSFSVSRSISGSELSSSNDPASNQPINAANKFTTPPLCCIVCGDSSSGKHYGIQVSQFEI